jgi:hypothetical protein
MAIAESVDRPDPIVVPAKLRGLPWDSVVDVDFWEDPADGPRPAMISETA